MPSSPTPPPRAPLALLGLALALALPTLAACGGSTATGASADCSGFTAEDGSPDFEPGGRPSGVLPDATGKGLQCSQDALRTQGFTSASHDATGQGRAQASDRNWKVCFQAPAPGSQNPLTQVQFGAVKLREACPGRDVGAEQIKAEAAKAKAKMKAEGVVFPGDEQ